MKMNIERSTFSESICPLCSQVFPREQIHEHSTSEHPLLRQRTIQVIQAYHPGWVEERGACEACWKSYRDAGRILNVLKEARRRFDSEYWSPAQPAASTPRAASGDPLGTDE